jgi:hypothetical protein
MNDRFSTFRQSFHKKHIEEPRIGERGRRHKNSNHISSDGNKDAANSIMWDMVSMINKGEIALLMDFKLYE